MQLYEMPVIWIPWVEAALLGVLLLITAIQPHTILNSWQTLTSPIRRRYQIGSNLIWTNGLRLLFQWCTISLAMLTALANYLGQSQAITPQQWMMAAGWTMGVGIVKGLVDKWIQLTFRYTMHEKTYYQYRNELWMIMGIVLWIVLLFSPWIHTTLSWAIPCGVMVAYYGILWWKIVQAFGWTIQHILFAGMYMLHAEVLPMAVAIVGISRFVL